MNYSEESNKLSKYDLAMSKKRKILDSPPDPDPHQNVLGSIVILQTDRHM